MPATSEDFFRALYGDVEEDAGLISIFTLPDRRTLYFTPGQLQSCDERARSAALQGRDVFFRITMLREMPQSGRGASDNISVVPAFWIDIDVKTGTHAKDDLPEDIGNAVDALNELEQTPSIVICTGGGLHAYWLLTEPWELYDSREVQEAAAAVERFQNSIRKFFRQRGWHVDKTSDLARILRPPETHNQKYDPPRAVEFLTFNPTQRYEPEDLAAISVPVNDRLDDSEVPYTASSSTYDDDYTSGFQLASGRNDRLRMIVAACLDRNETLERTVKEVLEYDTQYHNPALFLDPTETACRVPGDARTNALTFVGRITESINRTRVTRGQNPQSLRWSEEAVQGFGNSEQGIRLSEWTGHRFQGVPPEREWLIENVFLLGAPGLVAAMGGAGKGMLLLDLALKVATPPPDDPTLDTRTAFGNRVVAHGTSVIFAAEDDMGEIHNRLYSIDEYDTLNQNPNNIVIVPLPNAGGPFPIVERGPKGPEISDRFQRLRARLAQFDDLKLVIFDPLTPFAHLDVNADPVSAYFLMGLLAQTASELGASVILAHHMRKAAVGSPVKTVEEARDAIRGTSALVDGCRSAYALWNAEDSVAESVCSAVGRKFEIGAVVHGAVVKSNAPSDRTLRTFVRAETGLLEEHTVDLQNAQREQLFDFITAIGTAHASGSPYSVRGAHGIWERRAELPVPYSMYGRQRLTNLLNKLVGQKRLVEYQDPTDKRRRVYRPR